MEGSKSSFEERHAWYYQPLRHVDVSERKRVMPMEVLNFGMMRTLSKIITFANLTRQESRLSCPKLKYCADKMLALNYMINGVPTSRMCQKSN